MGRKITPLEAANDACTLLDQAILLLDGSDINIPAAHADMARHSVSDWIAKHNGAAQIIEGPQISRHGLDDIAKYNR